MRLVLNDTLPCDVLKQQHKVINTVLNSFETFLSKAFNRGDANYFVMFFMNFVEGVHHPGELTMFNYALDRDVARQPIAAIQQEHDELKKYVQLLSNSLKAENDTEFISLARKYVTLFRNNIFKEDSILHNLIMDPLGEADYSAISTGLDSIFSDPRMPQMMSFAQMLTQKYPSQDSVPAPSPCSQLSSAPQITSESSSSVLVNEHVHIVAALNHFDEFCNDCLLNSRLNIEHAKLFVQFFVGFADKYHHAKEEDLLFPAAFAQGFPQNGPIFVMLQEHEINRELMATMKQAIEVENVELFVSTAKEYVQHLKQHIVKEDTILFRLIEQVLTTGNHEQLFIDYSKVDEVFNNAKELLSVLENLKTFYPLKSTPCGNVELQCAGCERELECHRAQ
ncbi:hypothetical protein RCL1_002170 [Eukaryota sp. TZLM3-RCL]